MAGGVDRALDYAEAFGWALTPRMRDCRGFYKNEAAGFVRGCHDASNDPAVIRALFDGHDDANISLTTGDISGVFVLDVDVGSHDGKASLAAMQAKYGRLPPTVTARTASGGGHLYFVQPDRALRNRVNFMPGLDIRTTGGSVPLPPSYRQGTPGKVDGAYEWVRSPFAHPIAQAPAFLLELVDPPPPPRPPREALRVTSTERTARYVIAAVDGECRALASTKAGGGRNLRLFQAAANLGELVGAGLLPQDQAESALEAAAYDCGYMAKAGPHQVRATIASGIRRGMAKPREVAA